MRSKTNGSSPNGANVVMKSLTDAAMSNNKEPYTAKQIQQGLHGLSKPLFHLSEPLKRLKVHLFFAFKVLILTYRASKRLLA